MNDIVYNLSYLVINAFTTYIISKIYSFFLGNSTNGKGRLFFSYGLYYVINSGLYLFLNNVLVNFIINISLYIILTINYDSRAIKKLLIAVGSYFLFVITELLAMLFLSRIGIDPLADIGESPIIWGMLLSKIAVFSVISMLSQKRLLKNWSVDSYRKLMPVFIVTLCLLSLAILFPCLSINNQLLTLPSVITLSTIAIFNMVYLNNLIEEHEIRTQKEMFASQIESFKNEIELLKESNRKINEIKHSINDQAATVYSLLKSERYDEALALLSSISKELGKTKRYIDTGIVELDAIINSKIGVAEKYGVDIKQDIVIKESINIEPYDYVCIIGNLFNNALEAVMKLDKDVQMRIYISIVVMKGLFLIEITNPYNSNEIIIENKTYMTTKAQKSAHGYGINHVKSIVEKYNGYTEISHEGMFFVKAFLYNPINVK